MLEFGGMRSTPSLPLLPGPLWIEVVTPEIVPSMYLGDTELFEIGLSMCIKMYLALNNLQ